MPVFTVAGLTLATDLDLPELTRAQGAFDGHGWTITCVDDLTVTAAITSVLEVHTEAGKLWSNLSLAEDGSYLFAFPGLADFHIHPQDRRLFAVPSAGVAPEVLRHLLVDQVLPHLLVVEGGLVLHASAVAVHGRAVAFLGPSGAGKSSLAAGFVTQGHARLLADDYLRLREASEGYLVEAAYPGLRLWEDSAQFFAGDPLGLPRVANYTDKRRWAVPDAATSDATPLAAIVLLGDEPNPTGPACRIERVSGREVFVEIYRQTFRVPRRQRDELQTDLDRVIRLTRNVPTLLIEHRRSFEALTTVVDAIATAIAST